MVSCSVMGQAGLGRELGEENDGTIRRQLQVEPPRQGANRWHGEQAEHNVDRDGSRNKDSSKGNGKEEEKYVDQRPVELK
jgi:hypothetical protein